MPDQFDNSNSPSGSHRGLRQAIAELERRLRGLASGTLRHDAGNAIGAARNALALLDDESSGADPKRFADMAERNVERARRLLSGDLADTPRATTESGRNERNDLGSAREGDDGDAFGL